MCTCEDGLAYILGAPSIDDSLTTLYFIFGMAGHSSPEGYSFHQINHKRGKGEIEKGGGGDVK